MIKENKAFVLTMFFQLIFLSCFAQSWIKTGKHKDYPIEKYWVAIGTSDSSFEIATNSSYANISKQLNVEISASEMFQEKLKETETDYSSETIQDKIVQMFTENKLTGIEIIDQKKKKNTFYVLTVLEKEKYLSNLEFQIKMKQSDYQKNNAQAEMYLLDGKVIQALSELLQAEKIAQNIQTEITLFSSLTTSRQFSQFTPSNMQRKIKEMISNIEILKISGDNQTAKIGEMFPAPFQIKVVINDAGKPVPVDGLEIIFKLKKKKLKRMQTDSSGLIDIELMANAEGRDIKRKNEILVSPDIAELPQEYRDYLRTTSFFFSIEKQELKFRILTENIPFNLEKSVRNKLSRAIKDMGYKIDDDADLTLVVDIEDFDYQMSSGIDGTIVLATSFLNITLKDKEFNYVSSRAIKLKALKKSEEKAAKEAIKRLKIKHKEMVKLIEDLRE